MEGQEPRLAFSASSSSIDMVMVPVGNPGNASDPATGYGSVSQDYQIGKYDVTIGQYTTFLNAVAAISDPDGLYDPAMGIDKTSGGISQVSESGVYVYSVVGPYGATPPGATSDSERPITNVTWFDAARFANWMANGEHWLAPRTVSRRIRSLIRARIISPMSMRSRTAWVITARSVRLGPCISGMI